MQTLSKNEWIAVIVGIVVVVFFLGARFIMTFTSNNSNVATVSSATENTNNNMNQNSQATSTASATQLIIKDTVVGTGAEAKAGDLVTVNYTGKFADGKVFDSSIPRGKPFDFTLGVGMVIPGWDQGVAGMKVGGKRSLVIPSDLAYGPNDYNGIPGGSTLYFDVELVGVKKQ
jgi:FKBP-type peptidyl-prolyl cis-trans isomerase